MGSVATETSGAPEETLTPDACTTPGCVLKPHTGLHQNAVGMRFDPAVTASKDEPRRATAEVVTPGAPGEPESVSSALAREATIRDMSNLPAIWHADETQLSLLKSVLVPKEISNDQFKLFILVAQRLNLDPFKRQIYAVPYAGQMVIQTGIDGYRASAARVRDPRTGQTLYDGQDAPEWLDDRGVWHEAWADKGDPIAARVKVWRKGISRPFVGIARWKSYVRYSRGGEPSGLWATGGDFMLAKCAEALALRKAFPDELGGVYTVEEMEQAQNESRMATKQDGSPILIERSSALKEGDRQEILQAWQKADEKQKETALVWLREQGFKGDTAGVDAAEEDRKRRKLKPLSPTARIFTQFNLDGTAEQMNSVIAILSGIEPPPVAKNTADEATFDPDAVAKAHGETPPPDAPAASGSDSSTSTEVAKEEPAEAKKK